MEAILELPRFVEETAADQKPLFITFEGGEGGGKSTQTETLVRRLWQLGIPAIKTKEPHDPEIRRRLLDPRLSLTAEEELKLFTADRARHIRTVIRPALKSGVTVICDRFSDSTIAYQHYGRGLPLELVIEKDEEARQGFLPNLTFLLDVEPETGLSRKRRDGENRFEEEKPEFHRRVREGFLKIAYGDEKGRFVVLDAGRPKEYLARKIEKEALKLLCR